MADVKASRPYLAWLDQARILAIAGVVAIHVASPLLSNLDPHHPGRWWVANAVFAVTRWTVPVFVMISGALTLQPRSTKTLRYYKRRIPRISVPLIAWSILYWAFLIVYGREALDPIWLLRSVITATTYGHLYFLAILLGLALVGPVLAAFWQVADRRERLAVTALALCMGLAFRLFQELRLVGSVTLIDWWLPFVGYFLAGGLIRDMRPSRVGLIGGIMVFAVSAILTGANAWLTRTSGSPLSLGLTYSYLGPLAVLNALSAFVVASNLGATPVPQRLLRSLAALVMGVYLVNPMLVAVMAPAFGVPQTTASAIAFVALGTLLVLGASALIAAAGARAPLLRRIFV